MGLFKKKEQKQQAMPMLPKLPKLPDLPEMGDYQNSSNKDVNKLPSLPSNSIGSKFSRDTIKDAVSGDMGGDEDFYEESEEMEMPEHFRRPSTEEMEEEGDMDMPMRRKGRSMATSFREEAEPVFIRIDRFEESLKLFETIKKQISDIDRILSQTKEMKQKEETELNSWENELKKMKDEVEKIGANIFSKV